jgi:hypothetical protein
VVRIKERLLNKITSLGIQQAIDPPEFYLKAQSNGLRTKAHESATNGFML